VSLFFLLTATVVSVVAATIYTPSLPGIARDLDASATVAQWSVTVFAATFGLVQVWHGPASDRIGRWRVLHVSLWLFLLGTIVSGAAPSIGVLLLGRVLQGLGAAGLTVVPRAIASDSFVEPKRGRVFVYLSMATAVGATSAPLIGGWLDAWTGTWRTSFAVLALLLLVVLVLAVRRSPDMAGGRRDRPPGWRGAMADYRSLLQRRPILYTVLTGAFMRAGYFGFLTLTPFVLADAFALEVGAVGTAMMTLTAAFLVANTVVVRLTNRIAGHDLIVGGTIFALTAPLTMAIAAYSGATLFVGLILPLALYGFGQGIAMPIANATAVNADPRMAGAGASLLGFVGYLMGALGTFVAGLLAHDTAIPLAGFLAVTTMLALTFACCAQRAQDPIEEVGR